MSPMQLHILLCQENLRETMPTMMMLTTTCKILLSDYKSGYSIGSHGRIGRIMDHNIVMPLSRANPPLLTPLEERSASDFVITSSISLSL